MRNGGKECLCFNGHSFFVRSFVKICGDFFGNLLYN